MSNSIVVDAVKTENVKVTLTKSNLIDAACKAGLSLSETRIIFYKNYLASRGLPPSAEILEGVWQVYINNGNHYSGYETVEGVAVTDSDEKFLRTLDLIRSMEEGL